MEPRDRPAVAVFLVADDALALGAAVTLGEETARHMQVRRMAIGESLRLIDGMGHVATATLLRLARTAATVQVDTVEGRPPLPPVHLLAPIADRDRMLWLAEKATELGLTTWRPVLWKRSRSVKPRGEGPTFAAKVRSRMTHALEQSGGAWLPSLFPDATCERAIAGLPDGARLVLDPGGAPIFPVLPERAPAAIAVGPEGGFDPGELALLEQARFQRVRLEGHVLRFETAAIAGIAMIRAALRHFEQGDDHGQ